MNYLGVILVITLSGVFCTNAILPERKPPAPATIKPIQNDTSRSIPMIDLRTEQSEEREHKSKAQNASHATTTSKVQIADVKVVGEPTFPNSDDLLQSGALYRALFVSLAITVLILIYMGIRMCRIQKGSKQMPLVRKYGVLANRSDVEMVPLPLDDDDEDDTVFELGNHTVHH